MPARDEAEADAQLALDLIDDGGEGFLVLRGRKDAAQAVQRGADAGEFNARQREEGATGGDRILGQHALAAVAALDHEDELVRLARGGGGGREGAGGLDLAHEAQVAEAHDAGCLAQGREAQEEDRRGDTRVTHPGDVCEARVGEHGAAAGQHGAGDLGLAADALRHPGDLDAVSRAELGHRRRVGADALAVDLDPHGLRPPSPPAPYCTTPRPERRPADPRAAEPPSARLCGGCAARSPGGRVTAMSAASVSHIYFMHGS